MAKVIAREIEFTQAAMERIKETSKSMLNSVNMWEHTGNGSLPTCMCSIVTHAAYDVNFPVFKLSQESIKSMGLNYQQVRALVERGFFVRKAKGWLCLTSHSLQHIYTVINSQPVRDEARSAYDTHPKEVAELEASKPSVDLRLATYLDQLQDLILDDENELESWNFNIEELERKLEHITLEMTACKARLESRVEILETMKQLLHK
jgi:hypothetical protein